MSWKVIQGDCVEAMAAMPECSVDSVVCDPPYGLGFMGKEWDSAAALASRPPSAENPAEGSAEERGAYPRVGKGPAAVAFEAKGFQAWCEAWAREALRVLKPGGHMLAAGGSRTYHRLTCAVEDAGFEIRDTITWLYGSGFPKSLDMSKAIDKAAGAEREVLGPKASNRPNVVGQSPGGSMGGGTYTERMDTASATPDAEQWQGWGTALKPAHEPIVVARKPLSGTVAQTVLEHGTGALNVDGCRVGAEGGARRGPDDMGANDVLGAGLDLANAAPRVPGLGRWPANVVLSHVGPDENGEGGCVPVGTRLVGTGERKTTVTPGPKFDSAKGWNENAMERRSTRIGTEEVEAWDCVPECAIRQLDEQTGELRADWVRSERPDRGPFKSGTAPSVPGRPRDEQSGGASRFFPTFQHTGEPCFRYCAKASSAERNAGLDGFKASVDGRAVEGFRDGSLHARNTTRKDQGPGERTVRQNSHPTVKPIDLMRWLVRLVTPPGGTVLDPFAGSGTTGIAAVLEGFDFVGLEREPEYVAIAEARIAWWAEHPEGMELVDRLEADRDRKAVADSGQLDMFGES